MINSNSGNKEFSSGRINEFNTFIFENIKNFKCGPGWHPLLKDFLLEILETGWDLSQKIYGKEKFGGLRIWSSNGTEMTEMNLIHAELVLKYQHLALSICEICGEQGQHRTINGWEQTLCLSHFLEFYPIIKVEPDKIIRGTESYHLRQVTRIEFNSDYSSLLLYSKGFLALGKETLYVALNRRDINYYSVLKTLPSSKLTEKDILYINNFFSTLTECKVCGHDAVHHSTCLYCFKTPWNDNNEEWPNPYYESEEDYIKEKQIEWFLDKDDYRKLKLHETTFEKLPGHKIVFTEDDLISYKKGLEDSDNQE
ncbi:MAG: hypothetical protein EOP45_06715 [Sphingobacteriaceae bacterium]|nr:MAG: hypothetical protein EOP45_06715 [Sphingobacteriaceae bacterium]